MSKLEAGNQIREGLLIVVSILLAFGIDAAWDEGRDRRDERETLEALAHDFEQNRIEAEDVIRSHDVARGLIVESSQRTRGATLVLSGDSVAATFAAMASPRTFDPVRSTLDALLSSGRLELLRDVELRRALVTFANLMGDSAEDELYLTEGALRVGGETE